MGSRARELGGDEAGFTLVEVLVALALLATVLVGAEMVILQSMTASSVAKDRSVANGLLNSAMAEAVAIPFHDLESGLNPNATCGTPSTNCVAKDPYLSQSGSNYVLKINGSVAPSATSIVPMSNTNLPEAPIVPETVTTTPQPGITYNVSTYPTLSSSCTPGTQSCMVTVVVIVTWHSASGGAGRIIGEDGIATP